MKSSFTVFIAVIALVVVSASASAQENGPGPGTVELTIIPVFVGGDSESRFRNYDVGGSLAVNINRYVGVEGEGSIALGVYHQNLLVSGVAMSEAPPNVVDYSGNVTLSVPGGTHRTTPYGTVGALQLAAAGLGVDPFAFFMPSVTITADDRRQLDRGEPIARVLPGQDLEVAVFAAVPVEVDGDRLVTWMRRIEELKKSSYVLAIARFSNPPRIEDLAGLALEDEELPEIRECRPGRCTLKLSGSEMAGLQQAAADAGPDWKPAMQQAFRRAVLARVQAYLADGSVAAYDDRAHSVWPALRFEALLDHSLFLSTHEPRFVDHLRRYPSMSASDIESFVYWSKERLAGKPIVSVTHVSIFRGSDAGEPDALVAGKEIFSTHYVNASLGLTAIVSGTPGTHNYLAYINRSEVDALGGVFGGIARWFMQRRLKAEAATVLTGLRHRLEREPNPANTSGQDRE